ncbi:helix-turn-helix domain-containing protein [Larkinella soli]|uniref:helix-turn-helix domain-containing protein n=1 Tax=Larkinella soli TaxID=1770527 RepID=UPI000FFB089C|nr:helix-turn-helix transcriptional regulator [Larkinella soli]
MTISVLDLVLLLGAGQGFILAALLWFDGKGRRLSNRLLAVLIGLLAMASLCVGMPMNNPYLRLATELLPLIMVMPMGPLLYFYTRSLLDPDFRLGRRERRHFYPVVIDWGADLIGWTFIIGMLLGFIPRQDGPRWGDVMDEYNTYADIPRWISVTTYLLLSLRWLKRFQAGTSKETDETQQAHRRWMRVYLTVFMVFQGIWLLFLVPYIIPASRNPLLDAFGWYPIYIPIVIMIYWLGLRGYLHSRTLPFAIPARKAASTALADPLARDTADRLRQAMTTDRLFLDPELTVDKVGRHLGIAPKTVSAVLNQHLGRSFNAFVNEHRVEEIKRRLTDPCLSHLTLTGIAFECGFNSQATFQRTFKQITGCSPREYLSRQPAEQSE